MRRDTLRRMLTYRFRGFLRTLFSVTLFGSRRSMWIDRRRSGAIAPIEENIVSKFRALLLENENKRTVANLTDLDQTDLPEGDVLVSVRYSSLNYKDAMAITGTGKIVREWPMVPGIDLAGTVVESKSEKYASGDDVVLTGWGVGERHWGGYAQMARVKSEWLVPKPEGLTLRQTMQLGTAGLTAMLCSLALEEQGVRGDGPAVLVTGASGGVGGMATVLLSQMGYSVVAATGRSENADYLRDLGAGEIIGREEVQGPLGKPLESQRWGGAVDTVGGRTLTEVLKAVVYGGSVAACGLAGGADLNTTVYPFILRGVRLIGVDSGMCPTPKRIAAWNRLGRLFPGDRLDAITDSATLDDVAGWARKLIKGEVRGRVVVEL